MKTGPDFVLQKYCDSDHEFKVFLQKYCDSDQNTSFSRIYLVTIVIFSFPRKKQEKSLAGHQTGNTQSGQGIPRRSRHD